MDPARRGEMLFNDAVICFQGWQSCATCHPEGRTDALAWDLLNDGIGNPKSAKSMLLADRTPPAMGHGIRANMEVAISAGLKFILFHVPADDEVAAIGAYLASMEPVRSPLRKLDGSLSAAAKRGKVIFDDPKVGCVTCHPAPLYTDLRTYETDTMGPYDQRGDFDTPTLVEAYRTGPWLHDGRAVTMREVLKDYNKNDKHGVTSQLAEQQLGDLAAYVLSL
jgi:cytochrome c peroxidase